MVHIYSSTETATASKKPRFILSGIGFSYDRQAVNSSPRLLYAYVGIAAEVSELVREFQILATYRVNSSFFV